MNIALLTAERTGTHMYRDTPKQPLHVRNEPILIYTLEAFERHPNIDATIAVRLERWIDIMWTYAKQSNITRLKWVVSGRNTGHELIRSGLSELGKYCDISDVVMIYDGNQPMISPGIILDSLAKQKELGNAIAVIPCVKMVFKSKDGQSFTIDIPRDELLRTQTPHTYELGKLLWAHRESGRLGISNMVASCDLMYRLRETVYSSRGSGQSLKITTVEDTGVFTSLSDRRKKEGLKRMLRR